jgi:hypothetical protein
MNSDELLLKKFLLTFDLHRAGKDMMRQNLRRRYPEATDEEIQAKLVAWLRSSPPDTPGKPYKFKFHEQPDLDSPRALP